MRDFNDKIYIASKNKKAIDHFKALNVPMKDIVVNFKNTAIDYDDMTWSGISNDITGFRTLIGGEFANMTKSSFRRYLKKNGLRLGAFASAN